MRVVATCRSAWPVPAGILQIVANDRVSGDNSVESKPRIGSLVLCESISSEAKYRPGDHFALRSCSSADMNDATAAADKCDIGICNHWQPFRLNLETEVAGGIESDPATDAKGETCKAKTLVAGDVSCSYACQNKWLSPPRPIFY